ncbi:MAG: hypothetical protein HY886_09325 [Deltaproteobacteria bacterium]|nr:hypothetical protein [Deltaproteobacteria bacterium]
MTTIIKEFIDFDGDVNRIVKTEEHGAELLYKEVTLNIEDPWFKHGFREHYERCTRALTARTEIIHREKLYDPQKTGQTTIPPLKENSILLALAPGAPLFTQKDKVTVIMRRLFAPR